MEKKEIKKYLFIAALAVAGCIIVSHFSDILRLIGLALGALMPLIIGCVLAYIFNIIMSFFERHYFPKKHSGFAERSRRPVCLILSFAIVIFTIWLIMNIIIPEIVNAVKLVYVEIPPLFVKGRDIVLDKLDEYPDIRSELENLEIDKSAVIGKLTNSAFGLFGSVISFIGAVTSAVTNTVIGVIFAIYLLLRKDKLFTDIKRVQRAHFSAEKMQSLNRFLSAAHETFTNFFIGQFLDALILGTLTFIGASLLRLPYAAMTGTIIGVTALIPIVGALVGAGLSAFIICTVSPMKALIFLIFLVILQQIDNNIFYPKVVGTSVGLPGIWVLAAVTVGGGLFGIVGMILGVPLAATVYKLYFEQLDAKEAEDAAAVSAKSKSSPPPEKKSEMKKKSTK